MTRLLASGTEPEMTHAVTTRRDVFEEWLRGRLERSTPLRRLATWGRRHALAPYPFASACCSLEYLATMGPRFDLTQLGVEPPHLSPRHADLLVVLGTINHRLAPILRRVWEAMAEPRWVMAVGSCAGSGGPYDNYAVVQGADRIIPVDVYVPGCPPTPEQILDGLTLLGRRIASEAHP